MKRRVLLAFVCLALAFMPSFAQERPPDRLTPIDTHPLPRRGGTARFSAIDKWEQTELTFFILNCPVKIDCGSAHEAIRKAFQTWADSSSLTFTEVSRASLADIELQWTLDDEDFGVAGDTLAFAFFPSFGGDVFFDDAEPWTLYDGGDTDLFVVALHEIGHALGLDHSDDEGAVMFPYSGAVSNLGSDDIAGVQRLYGVTGDEPDLVDVNLPDVIPDDGRTNDIVVIDGTINDEEHMKFWTVEASAGETITFTMEVTTGTLDTYLAVVTADKNEVLIEDDDGLGGTDSRVTLTFPTAGEYLVVATRYDFETGDSSGDYRLTIYHDSQEPDLPPVIQDTDVELTLTNVSGTTLCGIWVSSSSSDDWGGEELRDFGYDVLEHDFYFSFTLPVDTYDILVADCFGNELDTYFVDVRADTEVEIFADEFQY